jgi:hypothetical protein
MKNVISLKVRMLGSNLFLTREYVSNPTLESLTCKNVTGGIVILIVPDRISVTKILNVSHNNN